MCDNGDALLGPSVQPLEEPLLPSARAAVLVRLPLLRVVDVLVVQDLAEVKVCELGVDF